MFWNKYRSLDIMFNLRTLILAVSDKGNGFHLSIDEVIESTTGV